MRLAKKWPVRLEMNMRRVTWACFLLLLLSLSRIVLRAVVTVSMEASSGMHFRRWMLCGMGVLCCRHCSATPSALRSLFSRSTYGLDLVAVRLRVNSLVADVMHVVNSVWASSVASSGGVSMSRVSSVSVAYSALRLMSNAGRVKTLAAMGEAVMAMRVYSSE